LLVKLQEQQIINTLGWSYGIRLVNTSDASRGRVEIHHPTYGWGTLCDDAFDITDGNVICRQLRYSAASAVYRDAHYGQGTGVILLDDTNCS
jgi:deleted-in-malignant-brain-tumors protein 1